VRRLRRLEYHANVLDLGQHCPGRILVRNSPVACLRVRPGTIFKQAGRGASADFGFILLGRFAVISSPRLCVLSLLGSRSVSDSSGRKQASTRNVDAARNQNYCDPVMRCWPFAEQRDGHECRHGGAQGRKR
jgi:hypothetical protein